MTETTKDYTAKEAIELINEKTPEQLEGFLDEAEDRVTVERAWQEKMLSAHKDMYPEPEEEEDSAPQEKWEKMVVFAGRADAVEGFASAIGVDPIQLIVIKTPQDMNGIKDREVICIGDYYRLDNRWQVFAACKQNGCTLVDEFDYMKRINSEK